jgi:hypothetical protein
MTQITVDPSIQQMLGGMSSQVAFCNESGAVVGRYIPEADYIKMLYASYKCDLSEEEMERRRNETGGCSLEEIWKRLGVKK